MATKPKQPVTQEVVPTAPVETVAITEVTEQSQAPVEVVNESQEVVDTAPVNIDTAAIDLAPVETLPVQAAVPEGYSPPISNGGVEPGTTVVLADGTTITHN